MAAIQCGDFYIYSVYTQIKRKENSITRKLIILGITGTALLALFGGVQPSVQAVQAAREKPIVHLVRAVDTSPQGVTFQTSIAVDGGRNMYVIDGTPDNPRVLKYDKQGRFLLEWGGKGSGPV